ncbi:MAG: hypothetical protein ACRDL2_18220 [Gaiellaceae bacterium]
MALLAEQPGSTAAEALSGAREDPDRLRYFDLVKLGFSPETSMMIAAAPVSLDSVTALLLPDAISR